MALNFTDIAETFEKARFLLEEESKKDQESEPFKSKYAAKELFLSLKSALKKYQDQRDDDDDETLVLKPKYLLAVLDYYIGLICVDTDELSTGEEHLCKCVDGLKDIELEPKCIIIVMTALNQLGILWSRRSEPNKSQKYLEQAEILYNKYMNECGKPPYTSGDLFSENVKIEKLEANMKTLDMLMTHTQYYLAQVYSALDDTRRAAAYCHSTLNRELDSKDFDPLDWSLNSATMSQFFLAYNKFTSARHHLASAVFVLEQYELGLQSTENTGEDFEVKWEMVKQKKADIARCWIKYAVTMLFNSKEELMNQADDEHRSNSSGEGEGASSEAEKTPHNPSQENEGEQSSIDVAVQDLEMYFNSLEVTSIEDQITTDLILDFSQARKVFLNAQKWVNVAKEYYTLDDHASDHVQLVQDLSLLYKLLLFFEPNYDRQCKMQKRRIDLLEAVLKELNPQYYLDKCRQLKFELGECYCDLLDTKSNLLRENDNDMSSHAVQKINHLAKQSIQYFTTFLDTFLDSSGEMPVTFSEEMVRPILLAHFFIGRLYSKIRIADVKKQLDYLSKSQHHFQFLATYCADNENVKDVMKEELDVSQEMVKLLPVKMEKILSST